MKTKPFTFLLAITFLFLLSGSVFGDDLQDGIEAYERKNYKEAVKWFSLSAEQGDALAQHYLGYLYFTGRGVLQDYVLAHMWWSLASSNGGKEDLDNRKQVEAKMSSQQIKQAQQLSKNWKPDRSKSIWQKLKKKPINE
jgi:hypothetical protein